MLRVGGSLKPGTAQASQLVRSFLRSERPSSLASDIMELGRINKTIYLLNYVDDVAYRRRVLTQINRREHRHRMIRAICYGRRGEIRKPSHSPNLSPTAPCGHSMMNPTMLNLTTLIATFRSNDCHGPNEDAEDGNDDAERENRPLPS